MTTGKSVYFKDKCKVMMNGERRVYVWRKAGENLLWYHPPADLQI